MTFHYFIFKKKKTSALVENAKVSEFPKIAFNFLSPKKMYARTNSQGAIICDRNNI